MLILLIMVGTAAQVNCFVHLQPYARFLLDYHLTEASAAYLAIARQMKLPLLHVFASYTEEQLQAYSLQSVQKFLSQIAEGTVFVASQEMIALWKADKLPGIPKDSIKGVDLTSVFSARKQLFHRFFLQYTQSPQELVALVQELEKLFSQLEEITFAAFVEVRQEELQVLNRKLQQYQEELQVVNEELQASNEDLREQIQKRTKAEQELEKDRNYLKAVLENVSDGIASCNEQGVLSFFNKAIRDVHGLPHQALPAEEWAAHYSLYRADGKTPMCMEEVPLFRTLRGEKVKDQEFVIAPKEGEPRTLLATGTQIWCSEGRNMGAVVVMRDITKQKKAENEVHEKNTKLAEALLALQQTKAQLVQDNAELERRVQERTDRLTASEEELRQTLENAIELNTLIQERENLLSSILDQSPVSTMITDAQGIQIRINSAGLKLFGVKDSSPALGKYNILKDEFLQNQPFFEAIEAVYTQGKLATFEARYHVKHVQVGGNKDVYVKATIFPVKNAEGKVVNAVIQHEDITQQKQAEQALKESEKLFRTIANAAPVTLWMSDAQGAISYVNQTWINWTGRPFEQHLGVGWSLAILEVDRQRTKDSIWQSIKARRYYSIDFRIRNSKGQIRWCVTEGAPRYLADGTFAGYVGSCIDITERKLSEYALKNKNRELENINADLDNFIYTASHDLRSPISNIEGLVLLLRKKMDVRTGEMEQKIMDNIEESVSRFKKTIAGLTEITKVQKGLESELEEVAFAEVLEDVKEDIAGLLEEAGAVVEQHLAVKSIFYGRHNLRSILYNLLSNAAKYRSPDRPLVVHMSTSIEAGEVVLRLSDNGLGISQQNLPKLFTMFRRLHTHIEGTGIGLYMIKRIIENKGGRIAVESALHKGTTFRVYFPLIHL